MELFRYRSGELISQNIQESLKTDKIVHDFLGFGLGLALGLASSGIGSSSIDNKLALCCQALDSRVW